MITCSMKDALWLRKCPFLLLFFIVFHRMTSNLSCSIKYLKNATSLGCLVCSKKCWQPTKITIKSKARLSFVLQLQSWRKDYETQKGDEGVIVKWLKMTSCFPGRREKLPLPLQFQAACCSPSSIVPLSARTSLDIGDRAFLHQLVLVLGKNRAKQECPKLLPHSAPALWKRRSCGVEGHGPCSHRDVDCTWPL